MREVNKKLYEALVMLHKNHINNGGKLYFSDKDYPYLNNTLDLIEVKYLGKEPDGDNQQELSENGEPMLTDKEAYTELLTRFNNIVI